MEEYNKIEIQHICSNICSGGTPKSTVMEYYGGNIPWLNTKEINFSCIYETEKTITDEGLNNSSAKWIPANSVIVAMYGATAGKTAITKIPLTTNQACCNLTINPVKADYRFVYYALYNDYSHLASLANGGAQQNLNAQQIKEFEIPFPPLKEQKRIANFLSSIDDKIELNRRINDNLEQQAQALFKSWFVDNSNPNWEETSLSEVASFVGGYSYTGEELTDCSNIAMATIKNFGRNGGFKADGFKEINPSAKLKECHYANLFDILVAHTDLTQNADVIGNAELLLTYGKYNSIIFSMDLVKVLPKETFPYRFLLAAMLKNKLFKGHSLGYVNGTTVLHLSKKALPDFEIRKPSDSESKMMDEVLASYYKRMAELLQENDRLISLRDTLIPKLMSGKLKINDLNC